MKKILFALYDTFSEFEITVATAMLKNTHQIVTVADTYGKITGESGLQFVPHVTYSDINPIDYDGIIIPGGDLIHIKDSEEVFNLTRKMFELHKLTAAICSGPYVLARAGVLKAKSYTVTLHEEQRRFLGCFEEETFKYQPVVKEGSVITAQGHAYVEFALTIAEQLGVNVENKFIEEFYRGKRNRLMEEASL